MQRNTGNDNKSAKRKSYKTFIDPNYDPSQVHPYTHNNWEKRRQIGREWRSQIKDTWQDLSKNSNAVGVPESPIYIPSPSGSNSSQELEDGLVSPSCLHAIEDLDVDEENKDLIQDTAMYDNIINDEDTSDGTDEDDDENFIYETCDSESESENDSISEDETDDESMHSDSDYDHSTDSANMHFMDNLIMFEASNTSLSEALSMIQAMSLRFNFSQEAKNTILEYTKYLAGPKFENLNISKYSMSKAFQVPDDTILYVFYCPQCCIALLNPIPKKQFAQPGSVACKQCAKEYPISTTSDHYFISIDMKYQLSSLLQDENIRHVLKNNALQARSRAEVNGDKICDVYDAKRYVENEFVKSERSNNDVVLTLNVNTDGAPIFESGSKSLWPIQCVINELPPKIRFKTILLAALWFTSIEPKPNLMNLYMKTFMKQIEKLLHRGITVINEVGEKLTFFVMTFCMPVDSVARPVLACRLQYNGYFGCSWCYIIGQSVQRCVKYVLTMEDFPERTHAEYLKDAKDSKKLGRTIRGVKSRSILASLPYFDCIWGFSAEYMHCVLLGVVRQLWELWSKVYLTQADRDEIDRRLIAIKPPKEIHRLPRLLKDRKKWKASEWRSWLLYYSVPCLNGILDEDALESYMLLVKSMHALLSMEISKQILCECELNILQFVGDCQRLYGDSFMTFNVHILLHLVESVRRNGPLWATSAFPFESKIGQLKKTVNGPRGVVEQIAKNILQLHSFKSRALRMTETKNSWLFCKEIFSYRKLTSHYCRSDEGAIFISQKQDGDSCNIYNRCIYRDTVFHSTSYKRPKKTDNTIVQLQNGSLVQISHFYFVQNKCHMIIRELKTCPFPSRIRMDHIIQVNGISDRPTTVPITYIKAKLISVRFIIDECCEVFYVCIPPNTCEVQ